jgi:hypothetical protein
MQDSVDNIRAMLSIAVRGYALRDSPPLCMEPNAK